MCFKINFPEKPKILLIEFLKARHIHWSLHCFSQTHTQIIFYFYLLPFFLVVVNLLSSVRASLVPQLVKNLPEMHLTRVRYLGWEDPLEQGTASHSSILAGEFLGLYGPWNPRESHLTEGLSHHFIIYNQSHIQFILSHFSPSYSLYYWCVCYFSTPAKMFLNWERLLEAMSSLIITIWCGLILCADLKRKVNWNFSTGDTAALL